MNWINFSDSDASWDHLVTEIGNPSPFQLSSWARFRSRAGWSFVRLVYSDQQSAIQVLHRRVAGVTIGWAAGGPLGSIDESRLSSLPSALQRFSKAQLQYLRISDFETRNSNRIDPYIAAGWERPRRALSSGVTLKRALYRDPAQLQSPYSSNWSRNLKRGRTRGVTAEVWDTPDASIIAAMHKNVVEVKKLTFDDWRSNPQQLQQFLEEFQSCISIVRSTSSDGEVMAVRGAVTLGDAAFDFLAATTERGRKMYASNVALNHLLQELSSRGIAQYDFGGVDKLRNRGVYDFKHGAGGTDCEYVGEFEHVLPRSANSILSRLVSLKLSA